MKTKILFILPFICTFANSANITPEGQNHFFIADNQTDVEQATFYNNDALFDADNALVTYEHSSPVQEWFDYFYSNSKYYGKQTFYDSAITLNDFLHGICDHSICFLQNTGKFFKRISDYCCYHKQNQKNRNAYSSKKKRLYEQKFNIFLKRLIRQYFIKNNINQIKDKGYNLLCNIKYSIFNLVLDPTLCITNSALTAALAPFVYHSNIKNFCKNCWTKMSYKLADFQNSSQEENNEISYDITLDDIQIEEITEQADDLQESLTQKDSDTENENPSKNEMIIEEEYNEKNSEQDQNQLMDQEDNNICEEDVNTENNIEEENAPITQIPVMDQENEVSLSTESNEDFSSEDQLNCAHESEEFSSEPEEQKEDNSESNFSDTSSDKNSFSNESNSESESSSESESEFEPSSSDFDE